MMCTLHGTIFLGKFYADELSGFVILAVQTLSTQKSETLSVYNVIINL